jgi:hypothetical protein
MKKIAFLVAALSFLGTHAYAILPPLWQSRDEIKSLLDFPDLGKYLESGELIMEIKKSEFGYLIITNKHTLEARIRYQPQDMPGPARFSWNLSLQSPKT